MYYGTSLGIPQAQYSQDSFDLLDPRDREETPLIEDSSPYLQAADSQGVCYICAGLTKSLYVASGYSMYMHAWCAQANRLCGSGRPLSGNANLRY